VSRTGSGITRGFYPEELAFIRADSELFEGVVSGQLAGTEKNHPYHLDSPRFDARPYGNDSAHTPYAHDFELEDSTFPGLIRRPVIARIIQNRKSILARHNATEGGPAHAPECPGILVAPMHASNESTYRKELKQLRAACPKKADNYISVGLPLRVLTKSVKQRIDYVSDHPNLTGAVWTSLVETTSVGPGGSMWDMHLWLFQRDQTTGKLKFAKTILYGIIE
jgi:hypothetical protein